MKTFKQFLLEHITLNEWSVGETVHWNSEAGHVSGKIVRVHKSPFKVNGYTKHASKDDPVYEIVSKTGHHAYHFSKALH